MNLLQAEFKSVETNKPEPCIYYLVTDGDSFAVAHHVNGLIMGFWIINNIESMGGFADIELDFEPTHFAEIKTGETK